MRPFLTLLLDSYRGLKSETIFWITLGLSGLVAVIFLSIGIDEKGLSIFFGALDWNPGEIFNNDFIANAMNRIFYLGIFSNAVGGIWLTFVATILALISCASIFPETMNEGSAGMLMTKKPSRLMIFFAKLTGSLLFVLVQVGLFVVIVFFAFRWRLGTWNFSVLWYIPALLLVFLNLYSVMVLIGVRTKSVLTSILVTMLVWGLSAGLNVGIKALSVQYTLTQMSSGPSKVPDVVIEEQEGAEEANEDKDQAEGAGDEGRPDPETDFVVEGPKVDEDRGEGIKRWLDILETAHLFLPKNGPIMDVAEEKLVIGGLEDLGGYEKLMEQMKEEGNEGDLQDGSEMESKFSAIGSSCLFCAVMLSLAAWSFCRKEI